MACVGFRAFLAILFISLVSAQCVPKANILRTMSSRQSSALSFCSQYISISPYAANSTRYTTTTVSTTFTTTSTVRQTSTLDTTRTVTATTTTYTTATPTPDPPIPGDGGGTPEGRALWERQARPVIPSWLPNNRADVSCACSKIVTRKTSTRRITQTSTKSSTTRRTTTVQTTTTRTATSTVQVTTTAKAYTVTDMYRGNDFITKWDAFSGSDPTHGAVNYQTMENAVAKGLVSVDPDGVFVLKVDDTNDIPVGSYRDSVRINTRKTYTGGLFIADIQAMPWGCSVWPAYWSFGDGWPNKGEIDILEGVNLDQQNYMTLHTGPNCLADPNAAMTGTLTNQQCATPIGSPNTGCGIRDNAPNSYGRSFNAAGGGVFAHLWDEDGIKVWRFPRNGIPPDITAGYPRPSSWGKPVAFFPNSKCETSTHFMDHILVINTTLCGDWAGGVWPWAGCPGTCLGTVSKASNFVNAKWKVNYVAVYN